MIRRFVVLAGITYSTSASAQDATLADALFRDAREALKAGDYANACPKLRESHRLDPSAGALLNLAVCERRLGRVATSWTMFRELMDILPPDDERVSVAKRHISELEPQVPRLRVTTPSKDAAVRLDGVILRQPSLDTDLPLDPGEHVLELVGPVGVLSRETITVAIGDRLERNVGGVTPEPMPATKLSRLQDETPQAPRHRVDSSKCTPTGEGQCGSTASPRARLLPAAYGATGVAVAGFSISLGAGMLALHDKAVVADHCRGGQCDAEGAKAMDQGANRVAVANAGLLVGVLGLVVAGAVFWHALQ